MTTVPPYFEDDEPSRPSDDRYEILESVGEGGMGEVFRARDLRLGREVALKRLKAWVLDERARARLAREAQAMAKLSHPNVVEVFDVQLETDLVIIMEFIEGPTLSQWMKTTRRAWRTVLGVFIQAGRGLAAAHRVGLVHRDFKPSNVMLGTDGRARVMDFGLARPPGASVEDLSADPEATASSWSAVSTSDAAWNRDLTATGMVVGTPTYMAPEQFQSLETDGRADQYAFCVALWQALCGDPPFHGSYIELGRAKVKGPPPWPPAVTVPLRLSGAIARGLHPDPMQRWPSMDRLLEELSAIGRPSSRRRLAPALIGGGLVLASLAAIPLLGTDEPGPECRTTEDYREALWASSRRDAVQAALSQRAYADATWEQLGPALDDYAERLAQAHHDACASSMDPTPAAEQLDARARCLLHRDQSFEALVDALAEADDAQLDRASQAVEGLPPLEPCDDPAYLQAQLAPPTDPAVAAQVEALRTQLARGHALQQTDRCTEALAIADPLTSEVSATAYAPLQAELTLLQGMASSCAADFERAEQTLRETYFLATELGHDHVALVAALELISVVGVSLERHDEGMQWSEHARAELARGSTLDERVRHLDRLGSLLHSAGRLDESIATLEQGLALLDEHDEAPTLQRAVLMGNLASVLRDHGRFEPARELLEQVITILEPLVGDEHPTAVATEIDLATVLSDLGEHTAAEQRLRRALPRMKRDRPEHPQTYKVAGNLAMVLSLQGRAAEAIELHREVLAGFEALFGPDHPNLAIALNNLGIDQLATGDVQGATASQRRALDIRLSTFGPEHIMTASSMTNLADAAMAAGDLETARREYARALPVFETSLAEGAMPVSYPLLGLGRVHIAQGDVESALPLLERALELRDVEHCPAPELFEARFELGKALRLAGREPERARQLVTAALEAIADGDIDVIPQREEARAWLRK